MASGPGCNADLVAQTGKHPGPKRYPPLSVTGAGHPFKCHRHDISPLKGSIIILYHLHPALSGPQCTYLPMGDPMFGSWEYCLKQPQKTLVYAKALQHWADLARPTPCQVSHTSWQSASKNWGSGWSHSPLLLTTRCSNQWSPQIGYGSPPPNPQQTLKPSPSQEHSSGRNHGTRMRGMRPTIGMGHLKLTVPSTANILPGSSQKTGALNTFTQWVKKLPGSPSMQRQKSLHRFAGIVTCQALKWRLHSESTRALSWPCLLQGSQEIASTLRRSQTSQPLLAEEQALPQLVGSTVVVGRMVLDVWGMMTIDMMTCQLVLYNAIVL